MINFLNEFIKLSIHFIQHRWLFDRHLALLMSPFMNYLLEPFFFKATDIKFSLMFSYSCQCILAVDNFETQ